MNWSKGDKKIYTWAVDELGFHKTAAEVYSINRGTKKIVNFYRESIREKKAPKILGVGCSVGRELFMLPKEVKNTRFWGVDISAEAIKLAKMLARRRGETNFIFSTIDANKKLPFTNSFFDIVLAVELVEHLKDPKEFFVECHRVLKKNGEIIFSTPNPKNVSLFFARFLPDSMRSTIKKSREVDFQRHGKNFPITAEIWDKHAHINVNIFSYWLKILEDSRFKVVAVEGSSFLGGSRFVNDRPFLLGIMILFDQIVDKLPFKPYWQMCMIIRAIAV